MKPAIDLAPTDPCACKSGLLYGECHKPIFDAPLGKMLDAAHDQYARAWSTNAQHYQSQGLYLELANDLIKNRSIKSVLDVGCGRGQGLEALRQTMGNETLLIGIDENPDCLAAASKLLGVSQSRNTDRMVHKVLPNGRYRSTYRPGCLTPKSRTLLVQSNLLVKDHEFNKILDTVELDAITLWFIGIHKANSTTELASFFEVNGDADYRVLVEDSVMELANRRLKAGGVVQLAVRANYPSQAFAETETRKAYVELLQNGRYVFDDLVARPYSEPPRQVGAVNVGAMSPIAHLPSFAVSIVLRKV